jgi:hypothetical protein
MKTVPVNHSRGPGVVLMLFLVISIVILLICALLASQLLMKRSYLVR